MVILSIDYSPVANNEASDVGTGIKTFGVLVISSVSPWPGGINNKGGGVSSFLCPRSAMFIHVKCKNGNSRTRDYILTNKKIYSEYQNILLSNKLRHIMNTTAYYHDLKIKSLFDASARSTFRVGYFPAISKRQHTY